MTACARTVPRAWYDQLSDGGLLELPLLVDRAGHAQVIITLRKQLGVLRSQALLHGGFMPLRDARGTAVPSPPPSLGATERIDERSRSLAHLSGAALRNLSRARRQQLLALALSEPRRRDLGLRAPRPALALYLTIEAPADRFIGGWPRLGAINADGTALALLAGGPKTFTRIEAYGAPDAERLLLELIETWKMRGRPSGKHLHVEVSFGPMGNPHIGLSWSSSWSHFAPAARSIRAARGALIASSRVPQPNRRQDRSGRVFSRPMRVCCGTQADTPSAAEIAA